MGSPSPVPAGRRQRKKALTRQAISDIATEMFMARGFDDVTVAEIAEAADVSVKTVFNHFGSKEELFLDREAEIFAAITGAIADRAEGRSITEALAAQLADHRIPAGGGWSALYDPEGAALFRRFLRTWHESPSLQARYRLSNERLAGELRAALGADAGLAEDDVRVRVMAAMMVGVIHLRYETISAAVCAEVPAGEVERRVRAVVAEGMARVARAFPDLDRRQDAQDGRVTSGRL
jgi:AcrR family transcriptional regulator